MPATTCRKRSAYLIQAHGPDRYFVVCRDHLEPEIAHLAKLKHHSVVVYPIDSPEIALSDGDERCHPGRARG